MTVFASSLLQKLRGKCTVVLLDMSDHRDLDRIGRLDFQNVFLALAQMSRWRRLMRSRPDIAYLNLSQNRLGTLRDGLMVLIATRAGVPTVLHLHGAHFPDFFGRLSTIERRLLARVIAKASTLIVLCETIESQTHHLMPALRLAVVPNGIADGPPTRPRSFDGPLTVGSVGALMEEKGILDLLTAFADTHRQHPSTRLVLCGDWWPKSFRMQALACLEALSLQRVVEFLPAVPMEERWSVFDRIDVFAMPTYYRVEGQPLSLLEAMWAGCAVIATRHACIPATVGDGAVLTDPRDPVMLGERLCQLVSDRQRLRELSSRAWRLAREAYDFERVSADLLSVFTAAASA